MDNIDRTQETEEKVMQLRIDSARANVSPLQGPLTCKCGGSNDRAKQGYATCSACYEEMNDGYI